jgi:hypothetical protein
MTNICIWRRQPTQRLSSYNLVKKEASSQSVLVANEFFEAPSLVVIIRACEFPMHYHEASVLAKELRSSINGVPIERKANNFPHLLVGSSQKELVSDYA